MNSELIFLYGPPGAGKSAVGQHLSASLNLPYTDLDAEITAHSQMTIPQIFADEGESGFRAREQAALRQMINRGAGVIALGGGALLNPDCRALAEGHGCVVLLSAPPEILLARLQADPNPRPLLSGNPRANLEALLARRAAHYQSFTLQIDTSSFTPAQAAWEAQVRLGVFYVKGMSTNAAGYDVRVQPGGFNSIGETIKQKNLKGPLVIVSDSNVGPLYAQQAVDSLTAAGYSTQVHLIPAGETHKTIQTVSGLWEAFIAAGMDRSGTVLALGGGVVSDLAGFAAATYLRGVAWAALPTTLLSMADASLGGKTGFDLPQGKNLIGAFYPPRLVLADFDTLASLPERDLRSGLGEVLKHGVISDPALFQRCVEWQNIADPAERRAALGEIVRRAMAVKIQVIQQDPYEKGWRAVLNVGHTIGHALELASDFQLYHGEAVGIGMVIETRMAEQIGLAEPGLSETIAAALRQIGLPTLPPPGLDAQRILQAVGQDKKRADGKVRFALAKCIGGVQVGIEFEDWRREYERSLGPEWA